MPISKTRFNQLIEEILQPNERIVSIHTLRRKSSLYYCILTEAVYYKIIRISDHKPISPYFSHPTFHSTDSDQALKQKIRQYLDKNSWYKFTYSDFFVLKTIQAGESAQLHFYLNGEYKVSRGKLSFYTLKDGLGKQHAYYLSPEFNKVCRALFSGGLLSLYRGVEFDKPIYVTSMAQDLVATLQNRFLKEWQRDQKQINFYRVDLPLPYLKKMIKLRSERIALSVVFSSVFSTKATQEMLVYYSRPLTAWQRILRWLGVPSLPKLASTDLVFPRIFNSNVKQSRSGKESEKLTKTTKNQLQKQMPKRNKVAVQSVVKKSDLSSLLQLKQELPPE